MSVLVKNVMATAQAEQVSLRYFGAKGNGIDDDSAAFNNAMQSDEKYIVADGMTLLINATVNIASNKTISLIGAEIRTTQNPITLFSAIQKTGFNILGPFKIIGTGNTEGTSIGIYVSDCSDYRIERPRIINLQGWAIFRDGGTNITPRFSPGRITDPILFNCWQGYEDQAGAGAEYTIIESPHIAKCANFGLKTAAGNVQVNGGNIMDNYDGVVVVGGNNHAHGMFNGVNINHNQRYNLHTKDVLNGESFADCHFYGNGGASGALFFENSKGIDINGGTLDCWLYNYKNENSGLNVIRNMYCPGGYGIRREIGGNNGHDQLLIMDCFGQGAVAAAGGIDPAGVTINDPEQAYVMAYRDGGEYQSFDSGTSTLLTYTGTNLDRRLMHTNGKFKVPNTPAQPGMYRIIVDTIFSGSQLNSAASYVEIKVNNVSKSLIAASAYSTVKMEFSKTIEIYLNANDEVSVYAYIVGTDTKFGDSVYRSSVSVSKIA